MPETRVNTTTHCRYCGGELTWIKKTETGGCRRCLNCHPIKETEPEPPKEKPKLLDVKFTEAQIREIVRDELENWHIRKPSMTRDDIAEVTDSGNGETKLSMRHQPTKAITMEDMQSMTDEPEKPTWRQKAKALGISLMKEPKGTGPRKKEDVLKEIESRKTIESPVGG